MEAAQQCDTICGDGGCYCETHGNPLHEIDHLMMTSEDGKQVICLCGSFESEWLPVALRTWTPVKLVYSVS